MLQTSSDPNHDRANLLIFPCRDKKPLTPRGLYDARPLYNWRGDEGEQWGAPCGASNGFLVIDVDKKSGGLETAAAMDWHNTLKIETPGGGFHLYYKYDEATCGHLRNGVQVLPGIDLRTNGGYVIVYGEIIRDQILPAPEWLLAHLSKPTPKREFTEHGDVGEGGRNHYLTAAAGRMQRIGVLSMAALSELNEAKCSPPLEEKEVESIFASVSRYAPESEPGEDPRPSEPYERASSLLTDFLSYVNDDKQKYGEPTGIAGLDDLLGGGVRPGELIGILAQGKAGKSALTHKIIHNWMNQGVGVGYASRELRPATEVLPNLLSLEWQKNALKEDVDPEQARAVLDDWDLYFSRGFGFMPLEEIGEWCRALVAKGVRRFVFDHLHHFCGDEDYKVIAMFSRGIKQLMMDMACTGIIVIQPKQLNPDQKISFNSIRGGAAVAQAIDALITLDRQRDNEGKLTDVTQVRLDIARHKLAKLGEVFLQYNKDTMDYTEVVPTPPEPSVYPAEGDPFSVYVPSVFNGIDSASSMIHRIKLKDKSLT